MEALVWYAFCKNWKHKTHLVHYKLLQILRKKGITNITDDNEKCSWSRYTLDIVQYLKYKKYCLLIDTQWE